MSKLSLTVNGQTHDLDIDESRTLAGVLRYDLGLTGAKIGCEEAELRHLYRAGGRPAR